MCSIRGIVSIGAIAPQYLRTFISIHMKYFIIFTQMKKIQQKVKSCTHSLEFLSTPLYYQFHQIFFFWQDFFCVLFYFWSTMKITQNYMKLYALSRFSRTLNLLWFCMEAKRNFEYSALLTQALLVY